LICCIIVSCVSVGSEFHVSVRDSEFHQVRHSATAAFKLDAPPTRAVPVVSDRGNAIPVVVPRFLILGLAFQHNRVPQPHGLGVLNRRFPNGVFYWLTNTISPQGL
jgi:hypothetical protein